MNETDLIKDLEKIQKHIQRTIDAFPLLAVFIHTKEALGTLKEIIDNLKTERALKK